MSLDCRHILVRPRHRHRWTRQVHLQVQHLSEVTNPHQETGAIHQKLRNKKENRDNGPRTTVCEIFQNGYRSSQKNPKIQKCSHTAHISHESDSERLTKVALSEHSVNCEVWLGTKMTRALCRSRTDEAVLWAEKFGDLMTSDHKVLNAEGESRNNHPYAVVSRGTRSCHSMDSMVRRVKEGTSAVLLQSGLDEKCGLILWIAVAICETSKIFWQMGKLFMKGVSQNHLSKNPFWAMVEYYPISARDQSRLHQFGKTVFPGIFSGMHWVRREFGKDITWLQH